MQDFEKLGQFYLGRRYDLEANRPTDELLLYDSKDLVTHALCLGMTGSGKTGLCLALIEEAAIDGVPALIVDPKGDLGNLLLTFPDLAPEDFAAWVDEDEARRKGKSRADFVAEQAALWKAGLASWGQDGARIARLRNAAEFTIYTPGSTAGVPLSILKSFAAPTASVGSDAELLGDRIQTTATSLLAFAGVHADPIKSREHILLSTIPVGVGGRSRPQPSRDHPTDSDAACAARRGHGGRRVLPAGRSIRARDVPQQSAGRTRIRRLDAGRAARYRPAAPYGGR